MTPSVGIYSHTRDRWGISYAQPMVLNGRQAGAAIEGVVRDERWETAQLAVDTHSYTDVAMTLARGVGLDLCPRLKELNDRHLFLPRGSEIPENLAQICHATIDPAKAAKQWDAMVHLFASVHSGHSSAITVLARYGSAARGDPLYEAMVQVGKLLRTVFLCDYFVNKAFRRELLRVLNRGEAVNALKRSIYVGRVASYQAKQHEEMQAVADALSLLANLVMAWNTMKMQSFGMLTSLKSTLIWYAENLSADHLTDLLARMQHLQRFLCTSGSRSITSISSIDLINYRAFLGEARQSYLSKLSGLLKKWCALGFPGVTDDALLFLKQARLKGTTRGVAVLTMDPWSGPYTDIELGGIQTALNEAYAEAKIDLADYLLAWLYMLLGQRSVQYAALKVCDVSVGHAEGTAVYVVKSCLRPRR